jgi:hypothetical protein
MYSTCLKHSDETLYQGGSQDSGIESGTESGSKIAKEDMLLRGRGRHADTVALTGFAKILTCMLCWRCPIGAWFFKANATTIEKQEKSSVTLL